MPHTKRITIGVIYRPPNQCKCFITFLGKLFENQKQAITKFAILAIITLYFFKMKNVVDKVTTVTKLPWILLSFSIKTIGKMSNLRNMQQFFCSSPYSGYITR